MTVLSYVYKNGDKEIAYNLKKPTAKDYQEAKLYSNKIAAEITTQKTKDGKPAFILRSQIFQMLEETGLWTKDTQNQLVEVSKQILDIEKKLSMGGGAGLTKNQARDLAIKLSRLRNEQISLIAKTRELDHLTLEAQIDNANFDYLVSVCLLNEEGNRVFKDVEDYKENGGESWVTEAASHLSDILYNFNDDQLKDLPENKFLLKYGFMNDKMQLINKDGHLVNENNQRIDAEGYLLNDNGERVDINGNLLDENGREKTEFIEFLDD